MTVWALTYPARPWSLNVERQGNRWVRSALVGEWRRAFALLALEARIPRLDACEIVARPTLVNRRSMPDTGACVGAVKAAVDGLVDAGVLVDDGPGIVRRIVFEAPAVTGADALIVEIHSPGRLAGHP